MRFSFPHTTLSFRHLLLVVPWLGMMFLAVILAIFPLPSVALFVGFSIVIVLALIDPVWALYAAILSVPVQEITLLPGGISYTQTALLLVLVAWGINISIHPERTVRTGKVFFGLMVFVWSLLLATATTAYSQEEAFKETLRWGSVVLIYVVTLNSLSPEEGFRSPFPWRVVGLVVCLLLAPSINAIVGVWQFQTGTGPLSFRIAGGPFVRSYGTIGHPNSFAGYINMGLPLAAAITIGASWHLWMRCRLRRAYWLSLNIVVVAGVVTLLLLAALLTSLSRGGWLGAIGGFVIMLGIGIMMFSGAIQQRIKQWVGVIGIGGILVAVLGNTGVLPEPLTRRVESITNNLRLFDVHGVEVTAENFAVVERMAHLQAAWKMIVAYPLTGVGPGNYSLAYEGKYAFQAQPFSIHPWYISQGHAHNYYLHIAAEAGSIGLLAYMTLMSLIVVQALAALRRTNHWFFRSVVAGCCGIIAAVAVHNLFENLHVLNMGIQLGVVWGLCAAIEKNFPLEGVGTAWKK